MNVEFPKEPRSYLVVNMNLLMGVSQLVDDVINKIRPHKIFVIGNPNEEIDIPRVEFLDNECTLGKGTSLEDFLTITPSRDSFSLEGKYFPIVDGVYVIKVDRANMKYEVFNYKKERDLVRGRVIDKLVEEQVYP